MVRWSTGSTGTCRTQQHRQNSNSHLATSSKFKFSTRWTKTDKTNCRPTNILRPVVERRRPSEWKQEIPDRTGPGAAAVDDYDEAAEDGERPNESITCAPPPLPTSGAPTHGAPASAERPRIRNLARRNAVALSARLHWSPCTLWVSSDRPGPVYHRRARSGDSLAERKQGRGGGGGRKPEQAKTSHSQFGPRCRAAVLGHSTLACLPVLFIQSPNTSHLPLTGPRRLFIDSVTVAQLVVRQRISAFQRTFRPRPSLTDCSTSPPLNCSLI